jgi:hypothetical protein
MLFEHRYWPKLSFEFFSIEFSLLHNSGYDLVSKKLDPNFSPAESLSDRPTYKCTSIEPGLWLRVPFAVYRLELTKGPSLLLLGQVCGLLGCPNFDEVYGELRLQDGQML